MSRAAPCSTEGFNLERAGFRQQPESHPKARACCAVCPAHLKRGHAPRVAPLLLLERRHALLLAQVAHELGGHQRVRGAQQRKRLPARRTTWIARAGRGGAAGGRGQGGGDAGAAKPVHRVRTALHCNSIKLDAAEAAAGSEACLLMPLGFTSLGVSVFFDLGAPPGGGPSRGTPRMSLTSPMAPCYPSTFMHEAGAAGRALGGVAEQKGAQSRPIGPVGGSV